MPRLRSSGDVYRNGEHIGTVGYAWQRWPAPWKRRLAARLGLVPEPFDTTDALGAPGRDYRWVHRA